jgi:uncharacterized protein
MEAVAQLCPQCGLCCNGVIFGDVELQRGDDAQGLAAAGIKLIPKGRKKAFDQPCACFDGKLCQIYADRPKRCRTFNCRQIQLVQAGKLTVIAAEKNIREAKRRADEVLRLVRALGDVNETAPLNRRYAAVMAQPMDFAGDETQLEMRSELMLAVGRLVAALGSNFLTTDAS